LRTKAPEALLRYSTFIPVMLSINGVYSPSQVIRIQLSKNKLHVCR